MKKFKIHIPYVFLLLWPALAIGLGFLLNSLCIAANGGAMPVQGSIGCPADPQDPIHSCLTHATHLKFLADWILWNHVGVMSPGDLFMEGGAQTFWPGLIAWATLVIKDHHDRESKKVQ